MFVLLALWAWGSWVKGYQVGWGRPWFEAGRSFGASGFESSGALGTAALGVGMLVIRGLPRVRKGSEPTWASIRPFQELFSWDPLIGRTRQEAI